MSDDRGVYMGMRAVASGERAAWYGGERHVCLLGPNGSGKGSQLIVPNLATLRRSALVIDPKGECAAITAARRREFSDVYVFNPFGVMVDQYPDLKSWGFNALREIYPNYDTFMEDVTSVTETQVVWNPSTREPHWDSSAGETVRVVTAYECTKPEPSLANVRDMLCLPYEMAQSGRESTDPVSDRVMAQLDKVGGEDNIVELDRARQTQAVSAAAARDGPRCFKDVLRLIARSPIPELRVKAQRFMEGGRELESVLATARRHTQSLDSKRLRADLSVQRSFRFEQMKEKLVTVYVILPADEMHIEKQGRWLRLVVGSFLRAMLKSPPSPSVGRVLCVIDEAAALGHFAPLEAAMGYLRGFGCQLFTVWQDLPQLKRNYEKGWESFVAACGALLSYAPNDMTTSRYLSELCGKRAEQVPSYSQDRETFEWRPSLGAREFPLFSPQRLMAMEDGEILCRLQGVKPFRTRGIVYTETPFFDEGNGPLRPNPYYKGR